VLDQQANIANILIGRESRTHLQGIADELVINASVLIVKGSNTGFIYAGFAEVFQWQQSAIGLPFQTSVLKRTLLKHRRLK
jgi:hypothetical protein